MEFFVKITTLQGAQRAQATEQAQHAQHAQQAQVEELLEQQARELKEVKAQLVTQQLGQDASSTEKVCCFNNANTVTLACHFSSTPIAN